MENTKFLNIPHRKKIIVAVVLTVLFIACFCNYYGGIKGTVIDNVTGKPIEGAVVVAQWTMERGFPFPGHILHKIVETPTNKDGKFSLSGTIGLMLEPPEMIVCKDGYIPWRNDMVFQSERENDSNKHNEWNNHRTYRLDKFTGSGQDIIWLSDFTSYGFMGTERGKTPKFDKHITMLQDAEFAEIQKTKNR